MKKYARKDEALIHCGIDITYRIEEHARAVEAYTARKEFLTVAGLTHLMMGLRTALTCIGHEFGSSKNPDGVRIGKYNSALEQRIKDIKLAEKELK